MSEALISHAIKTVWAEPAQDYQYNAGLARLTPNGGVIDSLNVLWHRVYVPKSNGRTWFHIYQVGQIPPKIFDISIIMNNWVRSDTICQSESMLIDCYLESGSIIPRNKVWIMQDFAKNFLIAIEHNRNIDYGTDVQIDNYTGAALNKKINLDNSNVIVRFYANAHFSNISFRDSAVNPLNPIQLNYGLVTNLKSYNDFIRGCDAIVSKFHGDGLGIYYQDGFITSYPRGYEKSMYNKILGFMWDESFKFEQFFDIKDIPVFTSKLDINRKKYLLLTDGVYDIIDFYDDIDFYLVRRDANGFKGVYINRVKDYAFRMVTHNAYAVDAELLEYYAKTHAFLGNLLSCSIYIVVRQGGKISGLLNQKNRIEELYKLNNPDAIKGATVNVNSLVPEWNAANLENSSYAALMRASANQINTNLVQNAYGYSSVVNVMVPPIHVPLSIGHLQQIEVPPGLQIPDNKNGYARRSIFCYDGRGKMVNYFTDASSDIYINVPSEVTGTETVELFNGVIDDDAGIWVNVDVVDNDLEQYGFRCYVSTLNALEPVEDWEDITGKTAFYTYTPGDNFKDSSIVWNWRLLNEAGLMPAVKSNAKIHIYSFTHVLREDRDGCLDLVVKARMNWSGNYKFRVQKIAPAQVTVFANGQTLIEDIDYYMKWPNIVIINREINITERVEIIVRSYGCGKKVESGPSVPYKPREIGFIKNGRLSSNNRYDIHNDKPIRSIVAGSFKRRTEVNFSEDDKGALNTDGRPYMVDDYILPVENFTVGLRTNEFYEEVVGIEERVSNYLSQYLPEPKYGLNKIVGSKWVVISPVLASMFYSIKNGYAIDANTKLNFDNVEVEFWLKPFNWLLEFDPAYNKIDTGFVHIAPHPYNKPVEVTQKQYELMEAVIKLKLNKLVDLTPYVKIKYKDE